MARESDFRTSFQGFRSMAEAEVRHLQNLSRVKDQDISDCLENSRVELQVYEHKVSMDDDAA